MELKKMRNKEKQILAAITADKEQPEEQPEEQPTIAEIKEKKRLKQKRIEQINRRINASYSSAVRFLNFRF